MRIRTLRLTLPMAWQSLNSRVALFGGYGERWWKRSDATAMPSTWQIPSQLPATLLGAVLHLFRLFPPLCPPLTLCLALILFSTFRHHDRLELHYSLQSRTAFGKKEPGTGQMARAARTTRLRSQPSPAREHTR